MVVVEKDGGVGGNAGGDGEEEILLLLFVGFCLSLNLFNRFLIAKSCSDGPGTCFIRSFVKTFFQHQSTFGFSASKVKIFSQTSSKGFCYLKIFLLTGSSFCRKLALLILSFVTQWLMSLCIPFEKSEVVRMYFCTSSAGMLESQICKPQTYEIQVITFYSDSRSVSPTGRTLVGVKRPENVWLFERSRLLGTVKFL